VSILVRFTLKKIKESKSLYFLMLAMDSGQLRTFSS